MVNSMKIERRRFLRAAGLAGLALLTPMPYGAKNAKAADEDFAPFDGPYFIMINCMGGWDTTRFLDPKGTERSIGGGKGPVNKDFSDSAIVNMGTGAKPLNVAPADYYGDFFTNNSDRITFIRGVDGGTNGHRQGERVTWSGTLERGFPSVAALIAAEKSASLELPVPFLTFGGYDLTGDLIVPTRLENMAAFTKIVAPSVARFDGDEATTFFDGFAEEKLRAASAARLEAAKLNATLPRTSKGLDALFTARLTEGNIGRVMDYYDPAEFDAFGNSRLGKLRKQAYLALSTFEAGVAVSANLAFNGWDHHSDVIGRTASYYADLFALLREIRSTAEARGLGDKVHIFVGSDFGRTPYENATTGKDHWAVGGWMHISANPDGGQGTFGQTDDQMRGMHLDADLNVVDRDEVGSIKVTPGMLHHDLRRLSGVSESPFAKAYPLKDEAHPKVIFK